MLAHEWVKVHPGLEGTWDVVLRLGPGDGLLLAGGLAERAWAVAFAEKVRGALRAYAGDAIRAGESEPARLTDNLYLAAGRRAFRPNNARLRAMAGLCAGPRVLDVGCGAGDLLLMLREGDRHLHLAGTEISRVAAGMALGRVRAVHVHLTDGIPPGPWNTIVMGQLLEHLADDEAMVDAAAGELVPGGRLVVSVPNGPAVQSPDHVREYTPRTLRALLRRVGRVRPRHWGGEETRLIMWAEKDGRAEGG
jgi:2-polyprenyl-3-methyl-5-hydroxy-6-metoxy-1,4-benzoquinol methylase